MRRDDTDRNIERHDEGLWYNRVRVFCDWEFKNGSNVCEGGSVAARSELVPVVRAILSTRCALGQS